MKKLPVVILFGYSISIQSMLSEEPFSECKKYDSQRYLASVRQTLVGSPPQTPPLTENDSINQNNDENKLGCCCCLLFILKAFRGVNFFQQPQPYIDPTTFPDAFPGMYSCIPKQ
jgi:hypothetical protein